MLYLNHNTTRIVLPRVSMQFASADSLRLTSTIDLSSKEVSVNVVDVTPITLEVSVTLPYMTRGEYRYEVLSNGAVVSRGLAVVEMENNEYKQYGEEEKYIQAE